MPTPVQRELKPQLVMGDQGDTPATRRQYALQVGLPGMIDALVNHLVSTRPESPLSAIAEWATKRGGELSSGGGGDGDDGVVEEPAADAGLHQYVTMVANSLATYDLDKAGSVIDDRVDINGGAMDAVDTAFQSLLESLVAYRPYLPEEYIEQLRLENEGVDSRPPSPTTLSPAARRRPKSDVLGSSMMMDGPPGAGPKIVPPPSGEVAIVFTDIQGSSQLWGAQPAGMSRGLRMHNNLLREKLSISNGYEVKTLGDAFMIAFQSPKEAVRFAQASQLSLTDQEWPKDLLQHPLCTSVALPNAAPGGSPNRAEPDMKAASTSLAAGEVSMIRPLSANVPQQKGVWLWRGIRIRIGIHYGAVSLETNPITGRADYFGPTVNIAARVEAQSSGGCTCVTKSVIKCLDGLDAAERESLLDPVVIPLGMRELKGCGEQDLALLLPSRIEARREEAKEQQKAKLAPPASNKPRRSDAGEDAATRLKRKSLAKLALTPRSIAKLAGDLKQAQAPEKTPIRGARSSVASIWIDTAAMQGMWPMQRDALLNTLNATVSCVEEVAVATEGQLSHCGGAHCGLTVVWNAGRQCALHTAQSVRFIGLLYSKQRQMADVEMGPGVAIQGSSPRSPKGGVTPLGEETQGNDSPIVGFVQATPGEHSNPTIATINAGLAVGSLLHGMVGNRRRFPLSIGGVVDLATHLAAAAKEVRAFCLAAGCAGQRGPGQEPQVERLSRPIDWWETSDGAVVQVDELDAKGLSRACEASKWGLVTLDESVNIAPSRGAKGWGKEYRDALAAADPSPHENPGGDCAALDALAEELSGDEVLTHLCPLKRAGRRLIVAKLPPMLQPHVGRQRTGAVAHR